MFAFSIYFLFIHIIFIAESATKPNILLILTDDQDITQNGMFPLKEVNRLLSNKGATFSNSFTSSPICCPSRASILTGLYAHNHHTKNNSLNGGCYSKQWRQKMEPKALPVLLQKQGYQTFFAGKYLNQYEGSELPMGWNEFYGLHGNSRYYNYTLRENDQNVYYGDEESAYLTDVIKEKALKFLSKQNQTFFTMVSVPAAHSPFTPAKRHVDAFKGITALKTPNFNHISANLDKHWLVASARLIPEFTLDTMDIYFQQRWETLMAVDELVSDLITQLKLSNQLENTYIIYTSDNGYHVGQFAMPFDKRQPYETDIRVPLVIRGPKIAANIKISAPVVLIDLLPSMLEWIDVDIPSHLDGKSFNKYLKNAESYDALLDKNFKRNLLIEYWGEGTVQTYNKECPYRKSDKLAECTKEADCHCQDAWNNTYACVRSFRYIEDRIYCEFQDNESFVEAYDLGEDPYQLTNLGYELLPIERALYSLQIANLTQCSGASCND